VQVAAESALLQRDKEGLEIDQGIFVSAVLANPLSGRHLCHAMLLPRAEAVRAAGGAGKKRSRGSRRGRSVAQRQGFLRDPEESRHLNAEDDTTLDAAEIAVDLAILDPRTQICVLRGDTVQGGKHQGRRVLGSGINLTHLYYGKVPFIWYLQRDLGIVNKIYRGLARPTQYRTTSPGGPWRNPGSRWWKDSPSAGTASTCSSWTTCSRRRMHS